MVQRATLVLVLGFLSLLTNAIIVRGDDTAAAKIVTIVGIVKPARPDHTEAATVLFKNVLFRIVNDAKGKIVARDAAGKKAEIKGTLETHNGTMWITVSWCALVE